MEEGFTLKEFLLQNLLCWEGKKKIYFLCIFLFCSRKLGKKLSDSLGKKWKSTIKKLTKAHKYFY